MQKQPEDGYPRHIVAVTGVVTNSEGRVLLLKGDRRSWEHDLEVKATLRSP